MSFLDRVLKFIGLQEQEELVQDAEPVSRPVPPREKESIYHGPTVSNQANRKRGQLVSISNRPSMMRVVVLVPRDYEDVAGVADHLKAGRPVIIRLDNINRDVGRRIVDFTSGSTSALDGSVRKIAEGIFLFTPPNIEVDTEAAIDSVTWPETEDAIFGES